MFASTGTPTASTNFRYIASSVTASGKIMSAPASTHAQARSIADWSPSTASASVRAMMPNAGSVRPSTAAFTRSTISSCVTIALPGRWPHRFAPTWSSMCSAAAPAFSSDRTVRAMLKAEAPKPVSTSTRSGRSHASVILRTSTSTSSRLLMPRSGMPSEPAATPPPDR